MKPMTDQHLAVLRRGPEPGADHGPDGDRCFGLAAEHVAELGRLIEDLVETDAQEIHEHQLGHRPQSGSGGTHGGADEGATGDRGGDNAGAGVLPGGRSAGGDRLAGVVDPDRGAVDQDLAAVPHDRRVVQEPQSVNYVGQYWNPEPYAFKNQSPQLERGLRVYEAHVGMAQEEGQKLLQEASPINHVENIKAPLLIQYAANYEESEVGAPFAPFLSFLPFVWGDYWVLGLADDYSWAVVGSPDREYLWILARSPAAGQDAPSGG